MKNVLKSLFESFLRSRRMLHHFERWQTLLGSKPAGTASAAMPPDIARALSAASRADAGAMLASLHSSPQGLAEDEAQALRKQFGGNEVRHEQPLPWWTHLWQCYRNPFNLLLTVLALVSYVTEDMKAALVIGSMVVLSTVLRFVQESRSGKAAERLKAMVSNTATVLRPAPAEGAGAPHAEAVRAEVPMRELVPGDVIALSAGDMIPADCRLLAAKDLFISQSALTGEAMPVEKFSADRSSDEAGVLERDNLLFMGTSVVSGSATALIVHTGNRTFFGALAQRVTAVDQGTSAFQAGINRVSWVLIRFMLVMAPLVLVINGVAKGDWWEAALFALSIAVGLTPEMLPMIVTATLAKGAVVMSRRKVIVKRLEAIHNFGAMDVLCTDKTGTLTQDHIVLERHTNAWGEASDHVLQMAYLNSFHQTGLKNLLDKAVLSHAEMQLETRLQTAWRKIDEVPFDFARRRMSVVVENGGSEHLLICKGALEEILSACASVERGDEVLPLDADVLARIHAIASELNTQGLRVVAVASRVLAAGAQRPVQVAYGVADETALTLLGYVAFLDPPKESTAPALRALAAHGVAVKVLTGDNELVARKVCVDVGIEAGRVVLGREIEALDDAGLRALAEQHQVFAKLTPAHKERIVRALHANGHVVGFMGDGINDAPALRAADIGISVDGAVDVAKESADIILLEKSLMVLEQGVVEGRRTFANMLKYIKLTASSNFGNVFSVLVASAFLPFLPMLPLHLLVQNLLYDVSQIAIPFDNVDAEFLQKPQRWNPADLGRFMLFFGPLSSVFDILTYAVMWFAFSANTVAHQTLFQSGWFVEGLLSQTLVVHLIRTRKIPFLQSRAAWPLLAMGAAIAAAGIWLPMGRLAHYFRLQALPLAYFPWLAAMLAGYATLTQAVKGWYARRFGWQ
ncbi:Mg2+-importing ATPase [Variovorax paradoxus]|uniref:magnesium-translocating P-type ATPase n=1 Tax=Variovorax TaxID=34072 RepID=UPI001780A2E8|nr:MULTISPECIES: magnesium-translocating P-type ATPase [Variovorax]MBD9662995.1 magnesium-translocating P-type ATPase [Variovorax sp. VRV01]MDP9963406.1 Mg2+-importing ATPase [Variovorax paradoxus]